MPIISKYLIVRISPKTSFGLGGVTSTEVYEEEIKYGEFNYIEGLVFEASRWEEMKLGVYDIVNKKVYFCSKKMKEKNILEEVKKLQKPKEEEVIPLPTVVTKKLAFGYWVYSNKCCHQFAVYKNRKSKKLNAILCAETRVICKCESKTCHRGGYFCPLHVLPVEFPDKKTHFVCLDCLIGFYIKIFIDQIRGKQAQWYNGILTSTILEQDFPATISNLKERIFSDTFDITSKHREEERIPLSEYEQQYVAFLIQASSLKLKKR